MSRRVLIAIDGSLFTNRDFVTQYVRTLDCAWWHHVSDVWLLTDEYDRLDVAQIAAEVRRLVPNHKALVLDFDAKGRFDGWLPQESWEWLRRSF